MKHIRLFLAACALMLGMAGMVPALAAADTSKAIVCDTLNPGDTTCSSTPSGSVGLNEVIKGVVNVLSLVIGFTAVLMIMFGGFKYVTASGDSGKITSAKNTIVYAVIGLVVASLAQFIVHFVLQKL